MGTCFFIGHHNAPESVRLLLDEAIERHIIEYGVTRFIVGHYGAFDAMGAGAVIRAKQAHPDIELLLLLPYHPTERPVEQWRIITKEKRAAIVVLDMLLLDTRQGRDLTGTLIADNVLQLLSYVAQTEREFIRQRQAEGIAAAKANGVRFGRRPMEKPPEFESISQLWYQGELSARAASQRLGVSHKTFLKWACAKKFEKSTHKSPSDTCILCNNLLIFNLLIFVNIQCGYSSQFLHISGFRIMVTKVYFCTAD